MRVEMNRQSIQSLLILLSIVAGDAYMIPNIIGMDRRVLEIEIKMERVLSIIEKEEKKIEENRNGVRTK